MNLSSIRKKIALINFKAISKTTESRLLGRYSDQTADWTKEELVLISEQGQQIFRFPKTQETFMLQPSYPCMSWSDFSLPGCKGGLSLKLSTHLNLMSRINCVGLYLQLIICFMSWFFKYRITKNTRFRRKCISTNMGRDGCWNNEQVTDQLSQS